jgi:recombinational DNA repair protein (RecF pathway)
MKSKSSGHIEPLTLSRLMVIKGKEFDYVGTAKGEEFYSTIKEDLLSLSWAGRSLFAVDVFSREQDADGAEEVFSLLVDFLSSLPGVEPSRRESFYWLFIWKLLVVSGFGLDLAPEAASDRVGLFLSLNLERPLKEVDFGLLDDSSAQRLMSLVESAWKTHF